MSVPFSPQKEQTKQRRRIRHAKLRLLIIYSALYLGKETSSRPISSLWTPPHQQRKALAADAVDGAVSTPHLVPPLEERRVDVFEIQMHPLPLYTDLGLEPSTGHRLEE